MKPENYSKYCVKGCEESSKWSDENDSILESTLFADDGDYYFVEDIINGKIHLDYESGIPDEMEEVSWNRFLELLMEDYQYPYKNSLSIPEELEQYCFEGCDEAENWASEYTEDTENCSQSIDKGSHWIINEISGDDDYIYEAISVNEDEYKIIPWEQYKTILLSGKTVTNYELY